jgi:hypothetical protein
VYLFNNGYSHITNTVTRLVEVVSSGLVQILVTQILQCSEQAMQFIAYEKEKGGLRQEPNWEEGEGGGYSTISRETKYVKQ